MTEVKHAGGIVSSSKVPALHLIPTEALLCLADRFQVGTERKGDGAWNALTKNQQCLDDNAFLIERCSHIIRHTMLLRDQLAHGYNQEQEDSPYENAGAIIFGGALMACAMARAKTEMHFSCAMCGCDIPWGTTSCKDCMEYACEAVGMPVGYVPPEKRAEDSTVCVQLDPGGMTGTVIESPDDWVVQDRVPARLGIDYFRWKSWPASCVDKLVHEDTISIGKMHGYVDPDDNDVLSLRCRRKDLPVVESPDDWVVQDRVPARATDRGAWVDRGEDYPAYDFSSRHWWTVGISAGLELEAGSVDVVGRTLHLICRRKDLPPIEAPYQAEYEMVTQDRVPRRVEVDWYRWVQTCGEASTWVRTSRAGDSIPHGYIDQHGSRLEVQCCRKDLPELPPIEAPKPAEEEWVDLNQYPDHVLRKGIDWIASEDEDGWRVIQHVHGHLVGDLTDRFRCLKKDCPYPLPPFMIEAGKYGICRNGQTVGPLGYNITQKTFFGTSSDVMWTPTCRAMKVDIGMSDEAERGWDIVKLVRE